MNEIIDMPVLFQDQDIAFTFAAVPLPGQYERAETGSSSLSLSVGKTSPY
nr:hypothetical protein [Marinicella sp. W31]MDC2875945.1 hypothetical protein [Marinicella sp. W31]